MAGFRTLRQRIAGAPDPNEVLPLDCPPHLRQPLLDWLDSVSGDGDWKLLAQMLRIDYSGERPFPSIIRALNADNDLLLDLVDARLKPGDAWPYLDDLRSSLIWAGSGWRVDGVGRGLEQVVDETVRVAVMEAIREAEASASQHLAKAWSETFSRDKNPTEAHAEMIRAVESAAIPIVTPKDTKATLGTIIGQLESQSSLYTTDGASAANDGVAATVAMMKMLWQQQTDRHGANPTVPATQERVEFLLPVAAALVHGFSSGAIRRLP